MKAHTSEYKNQIKLLGREITARVSYLSKDGYYILITENGDYLTTEAQEQLITETGSEVYESEDLYSVNPSFSTSLLKTVMKQVDIECANPIPKGNWIKIEFGLKVNDRYEYINFGDFFIKDEPIYNADSKSYTITAYDKMLFSMISYDDTPLNISYPVTVKNYIIAICDKLDYEFITESFPNSTKQIKSDMYIGLGMTYRDILDDLSEVIASNLLFNSDNKLIAKYITETNDIIDGEYLKDVNVAFGEKYGPVNSLVLSRSEESDSIYRKDNTSITENGLTELKLQDNIILSSEYREDFIQEIFNQIKGLEYYTFDVSSTGVGYYDPLDRFTFNHEEKDYSVVLFNDDFIITQGLVENMYSEQPEETVTDYTTSSITDTSIRNAIILAKKNAAEILLKVNENEIISAINLSPEQIKILSAKICLEGYTTINGNFSIDLNGNAILKNSIINMLNGTQLVAQINQQGFDFYYNGVRTIRMGSGTFTSYGETWNAAITQILKNQAIMWSRESPYQSGQYEPVLMFSNKDALSPLAIHVPVTFLNTVSFGFAVEGSLTFMDPTNCGVITTEQQHTSNVFVSKIVGDGIGNLIATTLLGDITIKGTLSDERFKKNIIEINESKIEKIKKIKLYSFDWKENNEHNSLGFIAQQLQEVDENLVIKSKDDKELLQVDSFNVVALLTKCVQEQQEMIESLKNEVEKLKKVVKND